MSTKHIAIFGFIFVLFFSLPNLARAGPIWSTNGHEYTLVTYSASSDKSWSYAQSHLADGWYLATITSAAEQAWVYGNIVRPSGGSEYWLGGFQPGDSQRVAADGWQWVTGEAWGPYLNWNPGEPNDFYGLGSEQHLAVHASLGFWNDEGNLSNITGYIAERSIPVPEPYITLLLGSGLAGVAIYRRKLKKA